MSRPRRPRRHPQSNAQPERYIARKGPWRCNCGKWVHDRPIGRDCGDRRRHGSFDRTDLRELDDSGASWTEEK